MGSVSWVGGKEEERSNTRTRVEEICVWDKFFSVFFFLRPSGATCCGDSCSAGQALINART